MKGHFIVILTLMAALSLNAISANASNTDALDEKLVCDTVLTAYQRPVRAIRPLAGLLYNEIVTNLIYLGNQPNIEADGNLTTLDIRNPRLGSRSPAIYTVDLTQVRRVKELFLKHLGYPLSLKTVVLVMELYQQDLLYLPLHRMLVEAVRTSRDAAGLLTEAHLKQLHASSPWIGDLE